MHVEVRHSRYLHVSKPERYVHMRAPCVYVWIYVWGPAACMYGCLRPSHPRHTSNMNVCMYAWGPWACMYVCMSDRPKQVCMYVWGSWACMYVCMFELQTYPKHVCMSDRPKEVCMYVWGSWACMYVSLKATKSACFGGCQIPYQNPSKSDV